ncbi:MAG: LuxR C-terminal-related transcriptional regulator [Ktedonobacterales bacterium]
MSTAPSEYILAFDVMRLAEAAFSVDRHRNITSWNDAAEHLFGCPAKGLVGLRCRDVLDALHLRQCPYCTIHDASGQGADTGAARTADALPVLQVPQVAAPVITPEKGIVLSAFAARSLAGETRIVHLVQVLPDQMQTSDSGMGSAISTEGAPDESKGGGKTLAFSISPQVPVRLTQREREILDMLAKGRATDEIADTLSISRVTARNHIAHVIAKLGASTRLQAVVAAARVGLL